MRASSNPSGDLPPKPKTRNVKADAELVWWWDNRRTGGRRLERVRETWVCKALADGWTIGYRIAAVAGVPRVAEERMWPTGSPPWPETRLVRSESSPTGWARAPRGTPSADPNLDRARKGLSPNQALTAWREQSDSIDQDERHPFHLQPRLNGFDWGAPDRHRPRDRYLAKAAQLYIKCRREGRPYTQAFEEQLGIPRHRAPKVLYDCYQRVLIKDDLLGDQLTPYGLSRLDEDEREPG